MADGRIPPFFDDALGSRPARETTVSDPARTPVYDEVVREVCPDGLPTIEVPSLQL